MHTTADPDRLGSNISFIYDPIFFLLWVTRRKWRVPCFCTPVVPNPATLVYGMRRLATSVGRTEICFSVDFASRWFSCLTYIVYSFFTNTAEIFVRLL